LVFSSNSPFSHQAASLIHTVRFQEKHSVCCPAASESAFFIGNGKAGEGSDGEDGVSDADEGGAFEAGGNNRIDRNALTAFFHAVDPACINSTVPVMSVIVACWANANEKLKMRNEQSKSRFLIFTNNSLS